MNSNKILNSMYLNIKRSTKLGIFGILALISQNIYAQSINYDETGGQKANTITTTVPFLMISPDSRAGGMGDAGVATSPDASSIHWNASKLAFADQELGVSISYTPWLTGLGIKDINLAYLSSYYKIQNVGTVALSLRYFSLGEIIFTNSSGETIGQFEPNEFAFDIAYATKLADKVSVGGAVRYINSNLTNNQAVNGAATKPGRSVAVDISTTYKNDELKLGDKKSAMTIGLNISNIGAKMTYSSIGTSINSGNFLPINMRLGGGLEMKLDKFNTIAIVAEANKLLVPTSPEYSLDPTTGEKIDDGNGGYEISKGVDPNRGIASGIFGSFSDAPGGGKEEFREINYAAGLEYWYDKKFAIRTGYFYEHETKGGRKYLTLGAGLKYTIFGLDFSYLIAKANHPLENTLRFTLSINFKDIDGGSIGGRAD
jgi:hypothetical protein